MQDELNKQKVANQTLQSELDSLHGRSSEPGSRTREASGRATPTAIDGELSRRLQSLQQQYNTLQAELTASKDVMAAREREVELLRRRVDDAEKECDTLREELIQSQTRINTLLEMNQPRFGVGSEDGDADELDLDGLGRGGSEESSEEASMAFDKVSRGTRNSYIHFHILIPRLAVLERLHETGLTGSSPKSSNNGIAPVVTWICAATNQTTTRSNTVI